MATIETTQDLAHACIATGLFEEGSDAWDMLVAIRNGSASVDHTTLALHAMLALSVDSDGLARLAEHENNETAANHCKWFSAARTTIQAAVLSVTNGERDALVARAREMVETCLSPTA